MEVHWWGEQFKGEWMGIVVVKMISYVKWVMDEALM